jgi:hypothetical protein
MHSEDDQIVPYVAAGPLSAKLLKNGTLKTYKDFPHGMPTTQAETINNQSLSTALADRRAGNGRNARIRPQESVTSDGARPHRKRGTKCPAISKNTLRKS